MTIALLSKENLARFNSARVSVHIYLNDVVAEDAEYVRQASDEFEGNGPLFATFLVWASAEGLI